MFSVYLARCYCPESILLHVIYFLRLTPQGTNWDDLAQKAIPAPFIPRITNELDVSNFSDEFTRMIPTDSPAIVPPNFDKIFKVRTSCLFHLAFNASEQPFPETSTAFITGTGNYRAILF
jgi:hypothetical protein